MRRAASSPREPQLPPALDHGELDGLHHDANVSECELAGVSAVDQIARQTDFLEAQLDEVRFHGCDLTRADFRGARLRRCEFRRTDLSGVHGVESLRGAAMEWPDIVAMAGVWADALGIERLDDDGNET